MRQINLDDYQILVTDEKGVAQSTPYTVRESLTTLLMSPELKLGAVDLLKRHRLGLRLLEDPSPILLEEADWQKLKEAVEVHRGYTKYDVELVQRVLEAPEVAVQAAGS